MQDACGALQSEHMINSHISRKLTEAMQAWYWRPVQHVLLTLTGKVAMTFARDRKSASSGRACILRQSMQQVMGQLSH